MTVRKKNKSQHPREIKKPDLELEWEALFDALHDVIEWALDIAAKRSRDYPEDTQAVENVRQFARAWLEGRRSEVPLTDVLTAIAIIFSAIERDDDSDDGMSLLGSVHTMLDTPSKLPAVLRLPGAARDEKPTAVIRRFPGHRNASAAFIPFAA